MKKETFIKKAVIKELQRNVRCEFGVFRNKELLKGKCEIFEDSYKIRFYQELYSFLKGEDIELYLTVDDIAEIAAKGINVISSLYDYYLKDEFSSINSWEDVRSLIKSYIDRDRYSKL